MRPREVSPPRHGDNADSPRLLDAEQAPPVRPAAPAPSPQGDRFERRIRNDTDPYDSSDTELGVQQGQLIGGLPEGRGQGGMQLPPPVGLHRQAPQARPVALDPYLRPGDRGYDDGPEGRIMVDDFSKDSLPPLMDHELEFSIKDAHRYRCGESVRSDPKTVGNFRFRILCFPSGTQSTAGNQVSAFVEADPVEGLDPRWCFPGVKYQLTIVNWLDYRKSVTKGDTWNFSKDGIDRGWHDMVQTTDLNAGWLGPENTLYMRASCYVRSSDTLGISNYNCKEETGFIGLKNHGATCYMNGLLQSLFHVGEFRRIVYSIESEDAAEASKDAKLDDSLDDDGRAPQLIQALQNVFYKMQTADQAVNCKELMKSFGWDTVDAFTQHDAQELNRILCDRLEERMKNTPSDGSIKRLFEGEMENYIECIDVDYKSRRNETFYDIQLNIKGERGQELQNIEESLREFTTEETLEGDNAYEAEGHGKQRAKKGIRFLRFPPVLNLQLKRFHFDLEKLDMVKLNTRFEFPRKLDLSSFAPGAGKYDLYAVVVHNGDVNSGHYYAHIRPDPEGGWFKFDDETVTPCSEYAAIEDNYGGSDLAVWDYFKERPQDLRSLQPPMRPRIHNAYMLVYIKEDEARQILTPPDPKVVNPTMVERCDKEVRIAEQRRREKVEQQGKIKIKLVFERDLCKMTGFWDHEAIPHEQVLKMERGDLVKDLANELQKFLRIDQNHLALFCLAYRQTRQVRFLFMERENAFRFYIPHRSEPQFEVSDPCLVVLCVASRGYDVQTLKWQDRPEEQAEPDLLAQWNDDKVVLLVVKYFCPQTRRIVTLGSYYLSGQLSSMVGWVAERLQPYIDSKEVAPLPQDVSNYSWECWEEIQEWELQQRNLKRQVRKEGFFSGDVIIWQMMRVDAEPAEEAAQLKNQIAPVYPVVTVADLALHQVNSIDVVVMLHDTKQPLCVDGMVSNGHWGPIKLQPAVANKAADSLPAKEERPEDAALALCPAKFFPAKEKEIKMDLRWNAHHVTGTICQAFGLTPQPGEKAVWLFHAPPSSTAEEPRNNKADSQTTLKELQRSVSYFSTSPKKPLTLHAVELPFEPGGRVLAEHLAPLCVRFFDDHVREVGSEVIFVPNDGNITDVLNEARRHIQPEWGISGPLRALEVTDSRLHTICRPDHPVRGLRCFFQANIFFHCVRVEADQDLAAGQRLVEIFHCDRSSQQAFAQPLLLPLAPGEKSGSIKQRCKEKLQVPDIEFKSWRLVRSSRTGSSKVHLKDDEPWDVDPNADCRLCLEHVHPNPVNARQSRHNKPLTIKA
eukprot:gb/GFBE01049357.1/.p1 GENE.gb/GFBE01049357.1/~~gb/GFBE01049357.1/.p1  ORF type:complete len:1302 (+),score=337.04 gb/GFBE01049357.1/:1-3906(+)